MWRLATVAWILALLTAFGAIGFRARSVRAPPLAWERAESIGPPLLTATIAGRDPLAAFLDLPPGRLSEDVAEYIEQVAHLYHDVIGPDGARRPCDAARQRRWLTAELRLRVFWFEPPPIVLTLDVGALARATQLRDKIRDALRDFAIPPQPLRTLHGILDELEQARNARPRLTANESTGNLKALHERLLGLRVRLMDMDVPEQLEPMRRRLTELIVAYTRC